MIKYLDKGSFPNAGNSYTLLQPSKLVFVNLENDKSPIQLDNFGPPKTQFQDLQVSTSSASENFKNH